MSLGGDADRTSHVRQENSESTSVVLMHPPHCTDDNERLHVRCCTGLGASTPMAQCSPFYVYRLNHTHLRNTQM